MKRRDLIKLLAVEAIALNSHTAKARASDWSYRGATGADFWGELDPEFETCRTGQAQSPINIEGSGFSLDIGSLDFNYKDTPLKIINDGKTVRVDYQPGSSLTLEGREYELIQFHFHQPSEHLLSAQAANMEAHFVHKNEATGDLVVLAVMMSEGRTNWAIESILHQIPPFARQASQVSNLTINALQLLPENSKSYYRYQGSLTTPPCSENVTWLVLKQPVSVSKSQLFDFNRVVGNNARPIQALNQRSLLQFD